MLFNLQNLLPYLACGLAVGQFVASAPHGGSLDIDHGLDKRATPEGMTYNVKSGAYTAFTQPGPHAAQQIKYIAGGFYRLYLNANPQANGPLLFSALYVPGEGIFTSSRASKTLPTNLAPDWARAVAGREHKFGKGVQHVEDATLWLYESTLAAEKKPHVNGKYPADSVMYTYGRWAGNQEPQMVKACGSQGNSNLIDPSCTEVLTTLGVKDGNNPQHDP